MLGCHVEEGDEKSERRTREVSDSNHDVGSLHDSACAHPLVQSERVCVLGFVMDATRSHIRPDEARLRVQASEGESCWNRVVAISERYLPGVIPTRRRKTVVNWLWLENPHVIPTSTRDNAGSINMRCARSMRR
jgi:hypothetical protein